MSPAGTKRSLATLAVLLFWACHPGGQGSGPSDEPPSLPPVNDDDSNTAGDDDDSAAAGDDDDSAGPPPADDDDSAVEPEPTGPARYASDRIHSPITPWVADRLWTLGMASLALQDDVFMKVGASSTASPHMLTCFQSDSMDLGEASHLQSTLDFFAAGDADGSDPFTRDSEAAESGRTAAWAVTGDPSPLEAELTAIAPRFAVIHYGANDMGMGTTYASAMPSFYEHMMELMDLLVEAGVVPVLTGISRRGDSPAADLWVESYNELVRGIAQIWQVPFIDLLLATENLPGHGLAGDGLHLNRHPDGACVLTQDGLEYGYNTRNLIVLEALERVASVVIAGEPFLDASTSALAGDGSTEDPFVIDILPFSHSADTAEVGQSLFDTYSGCESTADESGPELLYRLELAEETALRIVVMDQGAVDLDIHLLDDSGTEEGCLERADRVLETTVSPGVYFLSVDSWVDSTGQARAGDFLLTVVECDEGDSDCE